ncbi:asparagine synthase (glutamine-hydrolyzing) [Pseudoroseomonas deserti]|uniref:asparagine synthase (glutamine-hydrolyzing) n=1 Tax=Teichococcus deserti TaxID=1817963 RepID=A0A1V2GUI7_9PROT|nr:asparagine synthase (glutamine-hydrolyzing) [Pseudoroseomonas deserti]ONG44472.1 asparagine synthase (glutamine-hydrolyzing) [Pseudoroseomonas deserti]
MCGIAGLILKQGATPDSTPDPLTLQRLTAALAHRGPDGAGHHVAGSVALAHTRLAIIDLATGDQPLFAGSAALVGNGEVYNYRELRQDNQLACATGSDCEPPLHLFRRDGIGFAEQLRGMYALAIHDRAARQLVLARDPFGIKPLYIAELRQGIAFASEPQALIAAGLVRPQVRAESRSELLQMQFTTGAETIFEGIRRVLPGETIAIADGRVLERRRRHALPEGAPRPATEAEALAAFDAALQGSVDLHQRSDVPYGMFLSGGTDSAAVLAMMRRLNEAPVRAYTAGFDVPGAADERDRAAALAKAAGARHETITVTEAEVWKNLPDIVAGMDDPAADYAIIPTWFLARRARAEVKVVLSGEGGDEILGGYGRYRAAMRPWWLGGKAPRTRGAFDRLEDVLRQPPTGWRDGIAAAEAAVALPGRTRLMAAQALDVADWLPNDLLLKLDRCLMAHGVEGRTPFLDTAIAEAAFRLPDGLKVRNRAGKWLLREWLSRHFPAAEPHRPKQGFTVPVGAWIGAQGERLGALVAAQPGVMEVARPEKVVALFKAAAGKREGFAAWHLLFYALWHRRHIEGVLPGGADTFSYLAAR